MSDRDIYTLEMNMHTVRSINTNYTLVLSGKIKHEMCELYINPISNRGWGQKCPLIFFFKYLQNEERYDFALLRLLVITDIECFCQISRKNFDWLTSYCDFIRGLPKNSKKIFFFF